MRCPWMMCMIGILGMATGLGPAAAQTKKKPGPADVYGQVVPDKGSAVIPSPLKDGLKQTVPVADKLTKPWGYLSITSITTSVIDRESSSRVGRRITGSYHNPNRQAVKGAYYRIDVLENKSNRWVLLKQGSLGTVLANKSGSVSVDVPLHRFEKRTFHFEVTLSVEKLKELVVPGGPTNSGPLGMDGQIPIRPAIIRKVK